MTTYLLLLVLTIACLWLHKRYERQFFRVIPYVLMVLVCGLRDGVGIDFPEYVNIFNKIGEGTKVDIEFGYWLAVRCIQLLGGTHHLLFLLMACVTGFFYYRFIAENSVDFALSTMLYMCLGPFYFSSFNTMRQALAVAIILYAVRYMKKDLTRYMICVVFAGLFHYSSLVFLAMPYVRRFKVKMYWLYCLILSAVGYILLETGIVAWIINTFASGYSRYIDTYKQNMDATYVVFLIFNFAVLVFVRFRKIRVPKNYLLLMLFATILIAVGLTTNKMTMMITRFVSFGSPCLIIVFPRLTQVIDTVPEISQFINRFPKVSRYIDLRKLFYGAAYSGSVLYYIYIVMNGRGMLPYNMSFDLFTWIPFA